MDQDNQMKRTIDHAVPSIVLDFDFAEDTNTILAGGIDGLYAIRLDSGDSERLVEHKSYVSGVWRHPQEPYVVYAGYDGQLVWCDWQRRRVFRRVQAHSFWSWQSARSPDGRLIASVTGQYLVGSQKYDPAPTDEATVKLFDLATGAIRNEWRLRPPVQAVAISADNRFVAAANLMGTSACGRSPADDSWPIGIPKPLPAGESLRVIAISVASLRLLSRRPAPNSSPRGWVRCGIRWQAMAGSFGNDSIGDRLRSPWSIKRTKEKVEKGSWSRWQSTNLEIGLRWPAFTVAAIGMWLFSHCTTARKFHTRTPVFEFQPSPFCRMESA